MRELNLPDPPAYAAYLEANPEEWPVLDGLLHITISRFYRDREVFDRIRQKVLPELAERAEGRGHGGLRIWSAGCASGEEAYSVRILWETYLRSRFPGLAIRIVGTDADENLLRRAREACYRESSLKEIPEKPLASAFLRSGNLYHVRSTLHEGIEFRLEDIRTSAPEGPFDLVFCRNLVFTYYDESLQRELLPRILDPVASGGAFVIGRGESLPVSAECLAPWEESLGIYRKAGSRDA